MSCEEDGCAGISAFTRVFDALLPAHDCVAGFPLEFTPAKAGAGMNGQVAMLRYFSPCAMLEKNPPLDALEFKGGEHV
jgi:hypothetical protein